MTGEVTVFVAAAGTNNSRTASGSDNGTLADANAAAARTSGAASEAIPRATSGMVSEATTGGISRNGDRRFIINSKQQLQLFMSEHLNAAMESLNIDW